MIGRLRGAVVDLRPARVLLDVRGVGYVVHIPLGTYYALSAASGNGPVTLHVHTHVREDALALYGFATEEERQLFEELIAISGVGPRMALAVLSGIGAAELRQAVLASDRERLERIPGVGRKTAERILLELGDRLHAARRGERRASVSLSGAARGSVAEDAISALRNLGYSAQAARGAVEEELHAHPGASLQDLLKAALGRLLQR